MSDGIAPLHPDTNTRLSGRQLFTLLGLTALVLLALLVVALIRTPGRGA